MVDFQTTKNGDIVFKDYNKKAGIVLNMQTADACIVLSHSTSNQPQSRATDGIRLTFRTVTDDAGLDVDIVSDNYAISQQIEWECKTEIGELPISTFGSTVYKSMHKEIGLEETAEAIRLSIQSIVDQYITDATVTIERHKDASVFNYQTYHAMIEATGFHHSFTI